MPSAAAVAGEEATAVPHAAQKTASGASASPQFLQYRATSTAAVNHIAAAPTGRVPIRSSENPE
jgi:hypothetical protein